MTKLMIRIDIPGLIIIIEITSIMNKTILLFASIIFFSFVSEVHGAEWISIGKDRLDNELFFDHEVIIERSKDIIEVQMKGIYSDAGRKERMQDRTKAKSTVERYETLSHSLELQQINCAKREFRVLAYTDYSSDGSVLYKFISELQPTKGWEPITPDSMGERMYRTVCQSSSRKKK